MEEDNLLVESIRKFRTQGYLNWNKGNDEEIPQDIDVDNPVLIELYPPNSKYKVCNFSINKDKEISGNIEGSVYKRIKIKRWASLNF